MDKWVNKLLIILISVLILHACDTPKLHSLPDDAVILAFGDSLTSGVGVSKDKSYPAVLQELSGLRVINAGVSGETTAQGFQRLNIVLDQSTPDIVILIEGGNDMLKNLSMQQAQNNLREMILLINQRNIPVVLIGVPEKSLFSHSSPIYKELATEFDLVFDGKLISSLQRNSSLKSDIVHFNEKGYRKMAESIHQLLKNNGAL